MDDFLNKSFWLNDIVKVKLTEYGISILKEKFGDVNSLPFVDDIGYMTVSLKQLFKIFGYFFDQGDELPFEEKIEFVKRNYEPIKYIIKP